MMMRNSSLTVIDDYRKDINRQYHWKKGLEYISSYKRSKNWGIITKCTTKFKKWVKGDYPEKLLNRTKLNQKYSFLDIGCGKHVLTLQFLIKF